MAGKQILFGVGGRIVFDEPGPPVFNEFGATTTTTTTGTGSSCPDNEPEIYLTMFDADYAGAGENWCGLSFTPTQIQNGTEHPTPACPTSYEKKNTVAGTPTFPTSGSIFEVWTHWWTNTGLRLQRRIWAYLKGGTSTVYEPQNYLNVKGVFDRERWGWYKGLSPTEYYYNFPGTFNLGLISNVSRPLRTNYHITTTVSSPWFNTTTIGGIQYTWRTGNGW